MLELIQPRKTREKVLSFPFPEEIHCVDRKGTHHRLSEKNGIFFYEGKIKQYRFAASLQRARSERLLLA